MYSFLAILTTIVIYHFGQQAVATLATFPIYATFLFSLSIFSIMILRENSLSGSIRGLSVVSKKTYSSGLRSILPKFLRDIGDTPIPKKKNDFEPLISIVKKQNISPEISTIPEPSEQKVQRNSVANKKKQHQALKLQPRGLHNIGNTCYMNSTLQCLFHLRHFAPALLYQVKNWSFQNKSVPPVAYETCSAIKEMLNKGSALNLGNLKKSMGKKKPMFLGHAQQDAQQYLTNLLQILNQQLTRIKKKHNYQQLQGDPTKKSISKLSDQWWNYYLQIDNSIICDVFQGQTISTIKCRKCQKISVNFDNVWGLPITFHRNKSLYDLLINGWKSESLVQDYYCSGCKTHRDCTKLIQMFRLPKVLVIQLKRFQYEKGQKRKRKQEVKIEKYINIQKILNENASKQQESRYKLKGIVHHHGQAEYGHYYAHVFCDSLNKWYQLNDSSADEVQFSENSKSAYLLFYEQQY